MNDDFDKAFDRIMKLGAAGIAAAVVLQLALLGVVIWAIIALVQHFT